MIDKVVEYLQSYYSSITWVKYGDADLPQSPYGIVKGEKITGGRGIRIVIHYNKGCSNDLEDSLRAVTALLQDKIFTSRNGCQNQIGRLLDYTDVTPLSDDGTISMEALFLMPTTTF